MTETVQVIINGATHSVPVGLNVLALLAHLGIAGNRVAIERNLDILPRNEWGQTAVLSGDTYEIVHLVGGGDVGRAGLGFSAASSLLALPLQTFLSRFPIICEPPPRVTRHAHGREHSCARARFGATTVGGNYRADNKCPILLRFVFR